MVGIMSEFDVIKPWDLKRITKGKIGEWIAKDYYRNKGYVVWHLEPYYYDSFYSGTGKKYVNAEVVLIPLEKAILESTRAFDLLIAPEKYVKLMKNSPQIRNYGILKTLFRKKAEFIKYKAEEMVDNGIFHRWQLMELGHYDIKKLLIEMEQRHEMLKKIRKNSCRCKN